MLKQCVKKSCAHDHKAAVILLLMLEQPREFKKRVFQRKMPLEILAANPGRIVLAILFLVGITHLVLTHARCASKLTLKDTGQ